MDKLILGDCIDELRKIATGSVDLICTDPPYNRNTITAHSRHAVRNLGDLSIQEFFYRTMYDEFARVLKPSGIVLTFCDDLFYPVLFASSYHCLQGHGLIIWDKKHISFGRPVRKRHELVMYCSKDAGGQFYPSESRAHFPSVIEHSKVRDKEHDAQKPVELIADLIAHFSREGELVLDPFLGSGTTALAARNLKRRYIGIEINPQYLEIARKRLERVQLPLAS